MPREQGATIGHIILHTWNFVMNMNLNPDWRYAQFVQHLYWQDKVPDTCDNYVSTVRTLHRLQGLRCPEKGQIHYKLISQGLHRQCKKPVQQAEPMNHDVLLKIYEQVDFSEELQAVTWTAVLVAYTLILRVSNIGPPA